MGIIAVPRFDNQRNIIHIAQEWFRDKLNAFIDELIEPSSDTEIMEKPSFLVWVRGWVVAGVDCH